MWLAMGARSDLEGPSQAVVAWRSAGSATPALSGQVRGGVVYFEQSTSSNSSQGMNLSFNGCTVSGNNAVSTMQPIIRRRMHP